VSAELAHIPPGKPKTAQQELRRHYNYQRSVDLASNPDCSPSDTLSRVIEWVWLGHPDFEPNYDRSFFHPHPKRGGPGLRLVTEAD